MSFEITTYVKGKLSELDFFQPGKPIEEVEREFNIKNVIKMASNENPIGPSYLAVEAIKNSLQHLGIYPDGNGSFLKEILAEHHNVNVEQIILGNGSEEVMVLIASIFIQKGDEIIISNNEFISYSLIAKKVGAKAIVVPTKNWSYDLMAMLQAVTPRTRLLFIANPKNPTGTRINEKSLTDFLNLLPKSILVVLDEAYFEYVQESDHPNGIALLKKYPNLVVTRTFSKIYGLASLRIGYGVCSSLIASLLNRVRMPFNVNRYAQIAARAAIQDEKHLETSLKINNEGRQQLKAALCEISLDCLPSYGNFITIELGKASQQVYKKLLAEGIIVRPLGSYGMPNHIRVTIGTFEQNKCFVNAFKKVFSKESSYEM